MEIDLVKTKQELADALTQIHEFYNETDQVPNSVDSSKSKGKASKFFKSMFKSK